MKNKGITVKKKHLVQTINEVVEENDILLNEIDDLNQNIDYLLAHNEELHNRIDSLQAENNQWKHMHATTAEMLKKVSDVMFRAHSEDYVDA
jgi:uncharacterized protein YoxC